MSLSHILSHPSYIFVSSMLEINQLPHIIHIEAMTTLFANFFVRLSGLIITPKKKRLQITISETNHIVLEN